MIIFDFANPQNEVGFLLHKNPNTVEHIFKAPYGEVLLRFSAAENFTMMTFEHKVEPQLAVVDKTSGGHPLAHYVSAVPYEVRNPEYLRLIYGPEYQLYFDRLKGRSVSGKIRKSISQANAGEKALSAWIQADTQAHEKAMLNLLGDDDSDLDPRL